MKKDNTVLRHLFKGVSIILLGVFISVSVMAAEAEKFPRKSVTLIIPFTAGSGLDTEVRLIHPYFQKYLGVPVSLENIPGADRKIGLAKAYRAPNDGYTLITPGWPMPTGEVNFKPLEFTYIGSWTRSNFVVVVNSQTWKSLEDLIQAAKSKKLSCGLSGAAGTARIMGEILLEATGIKEVNWVIYEGAAEPLTQLAGKHLDFVITSNSSARPLVRAGKLNPIVVFADEKDSVFSEVPLAKHLGYRIPSLYAMRSLLAPPKLPLDRILIIEDAMIKAAKDPAFQAMLETRGMRTHIQNHVELRKEIEETYPIMDTYLSRIGFFTKFKE